MEPGSQKKISDALEKKGVVHEEVRGEQLSSALRKFQESQGLAATGFADHETLLRLGVDPKEIDKSLENFSGTEPGKAQADVSNPSDDAGKGGSGTARKSTSNHDVPPSDQAPTRDPSDAPRNDSGG
jgi:hypothetical protein